MPIGWSRIPAICLQRPPALLDECGYLPFAITLCGAMARDGLSVSDLLAALRAVDPAFLRFRLPNYPYPDVLRAIQASIDVLHGAHDPAGRLRYLELAVFSPAANVPQAAIEVLWHRTAAMTGRDTARLLTELARAALLRITTSADGRLVTLHDLQHDYLQSVTPDRLSLHEALLAAYAERCPTGWASGPNDGYFFQALPHHLSIAGRADQLRALLADAAWLEAKLMALGSGGSAAIVADYQLVTAAVGASDQTDIALDRVRTLSLALSAAVLDRYPDQVPSQVSARVVGFHAPEIRIFLRALRSTTRGTWLRPVAQALPAPGSPASISWQAYSDSAVARMIDVYPEVRILRSLNAGGVPLVWNLATGRHASEADLPAYVRGTPVTDAVTRRTFHHTGHEPWPPLDAHGSSPWRTQLHYWLDHAQLADDIDDERWQEQRNRDYWVLNRTLALTAPDGAWDALAVTATDIKYRGIGTTFICVLEVRIGNEPQQLYRPPHPSGRVGSRSGDARRHYLETACRDGAYGNPRFADACGRMCRRPHSPLAHPGPGTTSGNRSGISNDHRGRGPFR